MSNDDIPAGCGHEQAEDERWVCLVPDREGILHRVARWSQHCSCHGYKIDLFDWYARRKPA